MSLGQVSGRQVVGLRRLRRHRWVWELEEEGNSCAEVIDFLAPAWSAQIGEGLLIAAGRSGAHLSPASQDFWLTRFPRISPDAVTPVTNLIDRLRSSPAVAGLLGSSQSSYDIRRAMDAGAVLLACPAGTGNKDRLVANFFVYDMFRAAKSSKDTPAERRRPFHAFLDEVQTFDGASRGYLAALLEESGKYGMRLHLMSQQPTRLTRTTLTPCSPTARTCCRRWWVMSRLACCPRSGRGR